MKLGHFVLRNFSISPPVGPLHCCLCTGDTGTFWVEFVKKRKGKAKKSRYRVRGFRVGPGREDKHGDPVLGGFSEMRRDVSEDEEGGEEADEEEVGGRGPG